MSYKEYKIDTNISSTVKLNELFTEYDEYLYRTNPEWATYDGDHRYDDKLADLSDEGIRADYDQYRNFLVRLGKLDYSSLSASDKLNFDIFKRHLVTEVEGEKYNLHFIPLNQVWGVHIDFPQIIETQPASNYEDFEKYFSRLRGFSKQTEDVIECMRKGIDTGLVMPDFLMTQTLHQIESIIDVTVHESVFYTPLRKAANLKTEEREKLSHELEVLISNHVNKAYGNLLDFVEDTYIPHCRKQAGISSVPGGNEIYSYTIKKFTTLDLDPKVIHEIGLSEVERIEKEMVNVMKETGFAGSLDEFSLFIRTDKQFHYERKEELMEGFRIILDTVYSKLPDLFNVMPGVKCGLKEIESYRSKSAPAAYYYAAPKDRSRNGYFYVNTYDLPSRLKHSMTALTLHESVPGHHMQIAIGQEIDGLPNFRRNIGFTAFTEGWALYAESLGYECGMYDDPYQKYGALTQEIWRACRLVVDTGIHSKGWTREKAVDFMLLHVPDSEHDIRAEVDRYIAWPGQALAYKIGELKIKELRKKAEASLNSKFDLRSFNDNLIRNGAVPMDVLERIVNDWIEEKWN